MWRWQKLLYIWISGNLTAITLFYFQQKKTRFLWKNSLSLCLFVILLFEGHANAQIVTIGCSVTPPAPTNIPWIDGGCITLRLSGSGSTACYAEICFCKRTVSGTEQYSVKSIRPLSSLLCDGNTWPQMIDLANDKLITHVLPILNPCYQSANPIVVATVTASCWKVMNGNLDPNGAPSPMCVICPGEAGWCIKTQSYCSNGNLIQTWWISESFTEGTCTAVPPNFNWVDNTCYVINPCNH